MSRQIDIQGHRGARGRRPENTWSSFEYALQVGTPTLEMDVVITKDHQVVVSHEPWFSRELCRQPSGSRIPENAEKMLNIYEMNYDEVVCFDCGSLRHPDFPEQQTSRAAKPLLSEILEKAEKFAHDNAQPHPNYSIEIKSKVEWEGIYHPDPKTFTELVCNVIREHGLIDRSILQSFDTRVLMYANTHCSKFQLAYLLSRADALGVKRKLRQLGFAPDIYSPSHELINRRIVRKAHMFGMRIIPWTVNSTTRMHHLLHVGVDGFITDFPEVGLEAARVFNERIKA